MRLAVLAVLLGASPAFAHKLTVTVTPAGDRLRVVAAYDGGDPADGATAVLRDAAGVELGRVTLDADGAGELPRPAGEWVLTVDDGAGHRASLRGEGPGVGGSGSVMNRWLAVTVGLLLIGSWARWRRMRSSG